MLVIEVETPVSLLNRPVPKSSENAFASFIYGCHTHESVLPLTSGVSVSVAVFESPLLLGVVLTPMHEHAS